MNYYRYTPDQEQFASLRLTKREREREIIETHWESVALFETWQEPSLESTAKFPMGDFPQFENLPLLPVFSAAAWKILAPLIEFGCEALPAVCTTGEQFYFIHVMATVDCVDGERSEIWRSEDNPEVATALSLCLKRQFSAGKHIFKTPPQYGMDVIVSDEMRSLAQQAGLQGLCFRKLPVATEKRGRPVVEVIEKLRQRGPDDAISTTELRQLAGTTGFSAVAKPVVSASQLCLRLTTTGSEQSEVAVGASRIGGRPDLPDGIAWPKWGERSMSFLAQLNLSEIKHRAIRSQLPPSGWIFLFCFDNSEAGETFDSTDDQSWKVLHVSVTSTSRLKRLAYPKDLEERQRFRPCAVSLYPHRSLPSEKSEFARRMDEARRVADTYWEYETLRHYIDEFQQEPRRATCVHQLLGYPNLIQATDEEARLECQLRGSDMRQVLKMAADDPQRKALQEHAEEWVLLCQLDSDENAGMCWGDMGMLYFWIRKQDLNSGRVDRCWLLQESS